MGAVMRTAILIGPTIKQYRRESEISTTDLAAQVGISASYVRLIEQGRRQPSSEVAKALLIGVGCIVEADDDPWVVTAPHGEQFTVPVPHRRRTQDMAADRDAVQVRIANALERIANALEKN